MDTSLDGIIAGQDGDMAWKVLAIHFIPASFTLRIELNKQNYG